LCRVNFHSTMCWSIVDEGPWILKGKGLERPWFLLGTRCRNIVIYASWHCWKISMSCVTKWRRTDYFDRMLHSTLSSWRMFCSLISWVGGRWRRLALAGCHILLLLYSSPLPRSVKCNNSVLQLSCTMSACTRTNYSWPSFNPCPNSCIPNLNKLN